MRWLIVIVLFSIYGLTVMVKTKPKTTKHGTLTALRGTKITINCLPQSAKDTDLTDLAVDHHWSNYKGEDLLETRFTTNGAGDLEISNAQIRDSGKYSCRVRLPEASDSNKITTKTFEHKLIVYQMAGHKYTLTIPFSVGKKNTDELQGELLDLLATAVCGDGDLCRPGKVKVARCYTKNKIPKCSLTLSYKAVESQPNENCDEDCMKKEMLIQLGKAKNVLESKLLEFAKDRKSPVKPDMTDIESQHLITCKAGLHIKITVRNRCYPCKPGSYSGPNSEKCAPCDLGTYNEEYGSKECKHCPSGKTTEELGTDLKDNCLEAQNDFVDTLKTMFG